MKATSSFQNRTYCTPELQAFNLSCDGVICQSHGTASGSIEDPAVSPVNWGTDEF